MFWFLVKSGWIYSVSGSNRVDFFGFCVLHFSFVKFRFLWIKFIKVLMGGFAWFKCNFSYVIMS